MCTVEFDLEIGQCMRKCFPPDALTSEEVRRSLGRMSASRGTWEIPHPHCVCVVPCEVRTKVPAVH